jgi:hypothetical protein
MKKELGKISSVYFGLGGYQDCQLGIHFGFEGEFFGVGNSKCFWDFESIEHTETSKWSEDDRSQAAVDVMRYISKLLKDAKVSKVEQLKGKPVELIFDGACGSPALLSWRILTEVL